MVIAASVVVTRRTQVYEPGDITRDPRQRTALEVSNGLLQLRLLAIRQLRHDLEIEQLASPSGRHPREGCRPAPTVAPRASARSSRHCVPKWPQRSRPAL